MRILLLLLLWVTCLTRVYAYPALVISVHDGDTIRVRRHNALIERIRLASIDAPELKQPMGLQSRALTEQLTLGRMVEVIPRGHDRYGRIVATVLTARRTNVNSELVRKGLAWWYQDFDPENSAIEKLQIRARQQKIGIWASRSSVAPWDYRRTAEKLTAAPYSKSQWNRRRGVNQISSLPNL